MGGRVGSIRGGDPPPPPLPVTNYSGEKRMITLDNLEKTLRKLGFSQNNEKYYDQYGLKIDFIKRKMIYHKDIKVNDKTTSNFSCNENFVVFECVHRLLKKGYKPSCIELEPKWTLGRDVKGGKADILVKDKEGNPYLLIECKTTDNKNSEFKKEWQKMQNDGGQLLSYYRQDRRVKFLCLYTSDLIGGEIVYENYILNMQDNKAYLEENYLTESYESAKSEEEIFRIWNEIYKGEYSSIGIFERGINAYEIGKNALCFDDLKELNLQDNSKYNEFAKILRKYNISGKENAFDKLVNLFLCKIYDETYNKDNLDFVYRGVMADSFEDLQDRLMKLYTKAMKEFLKEDITYIENDNVDKAFALTNKNKKSMSELQEQMKDFIKQLKFYSNNDFAFLEVHNKELFYKNALILIAVVRLFENLRLTENKAQQFLGNLFELFLQKGMKQDEGQFFTPIQICEFIMYSLPLDEIAKPLKVIDYACGAGHFLNTYANFIKQNLKGNPKEYYKHIYGIEKEYRLSKVAKVSASMYGYNEINILYADALEETKELKNHSFDLLIANPPYSVKGFLETLSKKSLQNYSLYDKKLKLENNNSIECFFVERANQLLADNAKVAIILPSPFLNKDGVYQKAREIILKNFKIIAIVELGSNTFGATGISTVILFLKKLPIYEKDKNNSIADSIRFSTLKERSEKFLRDDDNFSENGFFDSYLHFRGITKENFFKLIDGVFDDEFENCFRSYIEEFKKSKKYKKMIENSNIENKSRITQEIVSFIRENERERMLYFSMLRDDEVLIVKSPEKNDEQKRFLGYEWSGRKGSEGLKEINSPYLSPLYEREDRNNKYKIAYLIKQAFLDKTYEIDERLSQYVLKGKLVDMMNYDNIDFNKAINLNSLSQKQDLNPFTKSKYNLIRLGNIDGIQIKKGKTITQRETKHGDVKVIAGGVSYAYFHNEANRPKNTITISASGANSGYVNFWNEEIFASDCTTINATSFVEIKFIFYILKHMQKYIMGFAKGAAQSHVYPKDIENLKIPFPPIEIQEQVVRECENIEEQFHTIRMSIEQYQELVGAILQQSGIIDVDNTQGGGGGGGDYKLSTLLKKLDEFFQIKIDKNFFAKIKNFQVEYKISDLSQKIGIGKRVLDSELIENGTIPVYSANVLEVFGFLDKEFFQEYKFDSVIWGIDGDWMVNNIPKNIPFYPTDHCGFLHIDDLYVNAKYMSLTLREVGKKQGFSRKLRASIERIKNLKVFLPPIEMQNYIIDIINVIEHKIQKEQLRISKLENAKKDILTRYLN